MTTPEDPWNQPPSYPPARGGYPSSYPPSQGGGYPPSQGGYPPSQGGYPPSQGGYPPSQGGYPPSQGGGYPPSQGGYPPSSQGGFPPYPPPAQGYEPPTRPFPGGFPPSQVPQGLTPPPGPPKKSAAGKIAGFATTAVVVVVVIVLKVTGASFLSNLFGDDSSGSNTPKDPWEGTPAAAFPFGADSLVMPAPAAVGQFTVEEVTAALDTVKQALVAGRLDDKMLYDHDTSTFAGLLSQFGREDLDVLINDDKVGPAVLTWIAPGFTLVEDGIRFKGEVTVSDDVLDNGIPVLVVESNYVWVYAFSGALETPGDHLVSIKDRVSWTFPASAEVDEQYIGMFIGAAEYSATGIDCDLMDQDLIALGELVDVAPGADVGNPDDAFDPNGSMDVPDALAC